MSMSVGVVEGSVGEGRAMVRSIGWWKMSYRWSCSTPRETSRRASDKVYGRGEFVELRIGEKMWERNERRVFLALRTWMEEMVHGRVVLVSSLDEG